MMAALAPVFGWYERLLMAVVCIVFFV